MPIRLNLLAEAQAEEVARRRDPVKRAIWIAALLVVLLLVWSSSLQLKTIFLASDVSRLQGRISSHTNEYQGVLENQNKARDIRGKLDALRRLSAARLLNGTLLNALQQPSADQVQLLRLRVEQLYTVVEGTKTRTNEDKVVIKGRPPTATENILLTLEGADTSANPALSDQVNKYKEAVAANPYFKEMLVKPNGIILKNVSPPQVVASIGKRGVIFKLECHYPEVTR
jgi:hypothetical protein